MKRSITKSEMIAAISMEHVIVQRDLSTRKWKVVVDADGKPKWPTEHELEYAGDPTGDIAFCPPNSGMKAAIHKDGRVTLDMLSDGPSGVFLDCVVSGDTFEEICTNGIKALHERVAQSWLSD